MSTIQPAPAFRNRQAGLIFFGIVEILFGLGAGAIALLVAATWFVPRPEIASAMPPQSVAGAIPIYIVFSVVFLILGIGSMMARRWARAVTLALSWMWLITGILTSVAMVAMSGKLLQSMPPGQGAQSFVIGCMVVFLGLFGIVVPLIFILFYRSPNVRATVESIDRVPRWTDPIAIPVLVFALWMLLGGVSMLVWSFVYPSIPIGSWIVARPASTLVMLLFAALSIFIAVGSMRLQLSAWWTAMAMVLFGLGYSLLLLPRSNLVKWFESSGMAADARSVDLVRSLYSGPWFWIWMGVLWIGYLAFLLYIRRFFSVRETNSGAMSGAAG